MGKSLKAAVIGTGVISKQHLSFLDSSDQSELVGVCDLSAAAAKYAAETFHAGQAFTDYQVMLAETKPDVVHILTPPNTHQKLVTDCLNAPKPTSSAKSRLRPPTMISKPSGSWLKRIIFT